MSVTGGLSAYLAVLGVRLREVSQYRAAAWAGVFTQVVFGFIILMSLEAFSKTRPERAPMSQAELLSYVWLGQAFLGLLPWNTDRDIGDLMKTGGVAYELLRPLDIYTFWFCRILGWRLAATALRCVPLLVLVSVVFPLVGLEVYALPAPPSVACAGAFSLALGAAVPLGVALSMLIQVTILWSLKVDGMQRIGFAIITLCGGMLVPLPMLPEAVQRVLYVLPFRGVVDVPYRAYSGNLAPVEAVLSALASLVWSVVLVLGGRALLARGLKRVVVHGG